MLFKNRQGTTTRDRQEERGGLNGEGLVDFHCASLIIRLKFNSRLKIEKIPQSNQSVFNLSFSHILFLSEGACCASTEEQ